MALKHLIGSTYRTGAGTIASTDQTFESNTNFEHDVVVPAGGVNVRLGPLSIDITKIKCMVLYASKALTVKTNSTSSPADTIPLGDADSIIWHNRLPSGYAKPFTANVTDIFLSNAGEAESIFRLRGLLDLTPGISGD